MSLRLRFAVLTGLAVFVVVALFGSGVYVVLATRLAQDVDYSLANYAAATQRKLDLTGTRTSPLALPHPLAGDPTTFAVVYNSDGDAVLNSLNASGLAVKVPRWAWGAALDGRSSTVTVSMSSDPYRLRVEPAPPDPVTGGDRVLVVGQSLHSMDTTLTLLRLILIAGGALALAVAGALGWMVAGNSLRPIVALTRGAESIGGSGDLSRRLPEPQTRDELARLSKTFNASLDRLERVYRALEEALEQQRRFVADASHELRTPLTVILSDAETLLQHPDIPRDERTECLEELVYEAKRMATLSNDLLHLARADDEAPMEVVAIDWDRLFAEIGRDATRICAPRPVEIVTPHPSLGPGSGDEVALRRALRILLDNVARHTPHDASVSVRARATDTDVWFVVVDGGPGVPPAALPRIFDRFFRADGARQGHGAGLGLAIARSVVDRHGGDLKATNASPHGLRITMRVPRAQAGAVERERPRSLALR
jgi:signal transduction histidine kinase